MIDSTNKTAWEGNMKTSKKAIPTNISDISKIDPDSKEGKEAMLMFYSNDEFLDTRKELVESLERAQRECGYALEAIKKGYGINSAGILQSTGVNIDKLSSQYMRDAQRERNLAHALGFQAPSRETCWK
tara:strand:+ start:3283 stop:3669 length:387 start_codon:yes stop_codon:yes gene_type:complete